MTAKTRIQDSITDAKKAGLFYVYDTDKGYGRRRHGQGFSFFSGDHALTSKTEIERCRKLAIPPAWTDVWICARADGHIQAVGTDARGRRQYRYHDDWRAARDENKFENMLVFARALPGVRRQVLKALNLRGLPRERVIAAAVRLLDKTGVRIGNDAYTSENKTFGLTTIRKNHVDIDGADIALHFIGKGGKPWQGRVNDAKVAKVLGKIGDLPGQRLFKYMGDDGATHDIASQDVNAWLQDVSGEDITAKDFRTWTACTLFLEEAMKQTACAEGRTLQIAPVLKAVAGHLGNTPAILQKSYVHPELIDLYRTGCFLEKAWQDQTPGPAGFRRTEALLLRWLEGVYG